MKQITDIRLANLKTLINEAGTQEKLASMAGVSPIYLNQIIKQRVDSATGKTRNIGNSMARKLEEAMKKPMGWLDQDYETEKQDGYIELVHYDVQSSAGRGKVAPEFPQVLSKMRVLEDWALENFGRNAFDRIRIITNTGDSMSPTIGDGDFLFIDITQTHFVGDGIYVLNLNGCLLTKRLKLMVDGRFAIISDNKEVYETEYVTEKEAAHFNICGRVVSWLSMRR